MKIKINNNGLTLVEILVAVSIFSLLSVVVSGIYVAFSNAQARATKAQRLLNDAQFALVGIAREIRNNQLYYDFGLSSEACQTELGPSTGLSFEACIFLKKSDGRIVAFAKEADTNKLDYLVKNTLDEDWVATAFVFNGVEEGVIIDSLWFKYSPVFDPINENINVQPFVTIQFKVSTEETNIYKRVSYNLQTSVSSRVYKR